MWLKRPGFSGFKKIYLALAFCSVHISVLFISVDLFVFIIKFLTLLICHLLVVLNRSSPHLLSIQQIDASNLEKAPIPFSLPVVVISFPDEVRSTEIYDCCCVVYCR